MCTAMTLQTIQGNTWFGRTMDFSYPLDPELYIVPKGYEWNNLTNTHRIRNRYSYIGIGQNISPLIFADGVNEMGFSAAALYFPGYARYDYVQSRDPAVPSIAAIELVNFMLGICGSTAQAASILPTIRIVGVKDSVTDSVAPLHWIIADQSGSCMVIEKTQEGLNIMDNPIGVLSNSPDFKWHLTNLRNYINAAPAQRQEADWGTVNLTAFGQGGSTAILPGGYTPPARFVRTAYQKSHAFPPTGKKDAVNTCFHLMESVTIPKGVVMTSRGTPDYTQYTAFINLSEKEYYFRTYSNSRIISASLSPERNHGTKIISLGKLNTPATFEYRND